MANRVVWILGAGASVGLGGPTLASLLSKASPINLEAQYQGRYGKLSQPAAFQAHRLYHHGRRWPEGPLSRRDDVKDSGELLWRDAEEFLDYLDTAGADGQGALAKRIQLTLQKFLKLDGQSNFNHLTALELSAAARRLVAAECCAFLEGAAIGSERWAPYVRWAGSLGQEDTVVTFNYDRVLELLEPRAMRVICGQEDISEAAAANQGYILKLHGSVDWRLHNGIIERTKDPRFALDCPDDELLVATPGPTKAKHTKSPALSQLWEMAETKIVEANSVVFVGYRFPPTDSIAREHLIGALIKNPNPLRCRLVLGHFQQSNLDAARVNAMLEFASTRRALNFGRPSPPMFVREIHPMLAEDFFAVFSRDHL